MRAIDTNLVVRFLVGDDAVQAGKARATIGGGDVFVSTTVLLETEWVLRRGYGMKPTDLLVALRRFAGLRTVRLEDPELIAQSLARMEEGMDFADALHLGRASDCAAFVTFDKALIRIAAGRAGLSVEEPA